MTYLKYSGLLLALAIGLGIQSPASAQTFVDWLPTGLGNWNADANWEDVAGFNVVPALDQVARIDTGGTAQVIAGDDPFAVGGIVIANGTVDVTAGGNLVSEPFDPATGDVTIDGDGSLIVAGAMSATSLQSSGTIRTVGAASALNLSGDMSASGTFIAELTSGFHGAVGVTGNATLGGALVANFNGAPTTPGSFWDIIDAGGIVGGFSSVSIAGATLPLGQGVALQQVGGGTHGNLLQLLISQQLIFHFDRDTKIGSIQNLSASPVTLSLDGYTIASALGSLNPAGWNSLEEQGTDGNSWFETGAGGTINFLAELNPTTSRTLAPSDSLEIGTIYAPNFDNVVFGQETEDHVFTYHTEDGQTHVSDVTYSGDKQENNIVLTVDPTTGDATMQNGSGISVQIDFYTIFSESGALLATWDSLEDQGVIGGDWLEANPSANRLSEVMSQCCTTLNQNEGFHLDALFNNGLGQDLTFQFLLEGTNTLFDGVVVYGDLPTNILDPDAEDFNEADFNRDGVVDGVDLQAWESKFGTTSGALKENGDFDNDGDVDGGDFLGWQINFDSSGGVATAAVPEPASLVLLLTAAVSLLAWRRR